MLYRYRIAHSRKALCKDDLNAKTPEEIEYEYDHFGKPFHAYFDVQSPSMLKAHYARHSDGIVLEIDTGFPEASVEMLVVDFLDRLNQSSPGLAIVIKGRLHGQA